MVGSLSALAEPRKETADMRCSDCCYYWKEEDELFPSCQWEARAPGEVPPCEEDDDYDEEDD